jgi:RNA polymerase sigma-70 factor, ECF subfamily
MFSENRPNLSPYHGGQFADQQDSRVTGGLDLAGTGRRPVYGKNRNIGRAVRGGTSSPSTEYASRTSVSESSEQTPPQSSGDPQRSFDAALAAAGDRQAFVRLVHATGRLVYATVLLAVREVHLAEDLTQETFLRAWRAIGQLSDPGKFNAWLIGIARSVVVDQARHRTRKKREPASAAHPLHPVGVQRVEGLRLVDDRAETPLDHADQQERREKLIDALQSLPEPQRQVLSLRYLAGADYETIAQQLSLTDGALRGHLSRGLAALRERLTRSTGVPPVPRCAR